jgi:hypothetical protein
MRGISGVASTGSGSASIDRRMVDVRNASRPPGMVLRALDGQSSKEAGDAPHEPATRGDEVDDQSTDRSTHRGSDVDRDPQSGHDDPAGPGRSGTQDPEMRLPGADQSGSIEAADEDTDAGTQTESQTGGRDA